MYVVIIIIVVVVNVVVVFVIVFVVVFIVVFVFYSVVEFEVPHYRRSTCCLFVMVTRIRF